MSTEATQPCVIAKNDPTLHAEGTTPSAAASRVAYHTGVQKKNFCCTLCQKSFAKPSSLKSHTLTHTGEKPFACHITNCQKRFAVLSNLRRHTRVHTRKQTSKDLPKDSQRHIKPLAKRIHEFEKTTPYSDYKTEPRTAFVPTMAYQSQDLLASHGVYDTPALDCSSMPNLQGPQLTPTSLSEPMMPMQTLPHDFFNTSYHHIGQSGYRPWPLDGVSTGFEHLFLLFACGQQRPDGMMNFTELPFPVQYLNMDTTMPNTSVYPLTETEIMPFPTVYTPFLNGSLM